VPTWRKRPAAAGLVHERVANTTQDVVNGRLSAFDHGHASEVKAMPGQKRKMARKSLSEPFVLKKLVRLAGIEPTTPWFVAKYSIQLSYSRPKHAL
jgi:hypothetical protein